VAGLKRLFGEYTARASMQCHPDCGPLYAKNGQDSMHIMPDMHKKPDFLDMKEIRV